jgi:hypothetical protein
MAAHHLQVQERLVADIADQLLKVTGTDDVAVVARGIHLCIWMRGVRTPAVMTTSAMRGRFREDLNLRQEFLALVDQRGPLTPRSISRTHPKGEGDIWESGIPAQSSADSTWPSSPASGLTWSIGWANLCEESPESSSPGRKPQSLTYRYPTTPVVGTACCSVACGR